MAEIRITVRVEVLDELGNASALFERTSVERMGGGNQLYHARRFRDHLPNVAKEVEHAMIGMYGAIIEAPAFGKGGHRSI